ncbi:hypothetical protein Avbf_18486 [Armadillidium vulgare]|nr:hypothetical protein Avbf_18486 [Armadillidium vulgare]
MLYRFTDYHNMFSLQRAQKDLMVYIGQAFWLPRHSFMKGISVTSEGKIEIGLVQRIITRRTKLGKPARRVPVLASGLGFETWFPVLVEFWIASLDS